MGLAWSWGGCSVGSLKAQCGPSRPVNPAAGGSLMWGGPERVLIVLLGFSGVPGRVLGSQGSGSFLSGVLNILGGPVSPQGLREGFSRVLREGSQWAPGVLV